MKGTNMIEGVSYTAPTVCFPAGAASAEEAAIAMASIGTMVVTPWVPSSFKTRGRRYDRTWLRMICLERGEIVENRRRQIADPEGGYW
jgi:hypothetical protein